MSKSPTQRTIAILKGHGATQVAVVEKWNQHAKIRQDLFGFADVMAVGSFGVLLVQATSDGNLSARVKKLLGLKAVRDCLRSGVRVEAWALRKKPDKHGNTLVAKTFLLNDDDSVTISECSESLCRTSQDEVFRG